MILPMVTITETQLDLYISLFRGRENTYARHWEKNGRSGYSPAYDLDWPKFMAFKAQGGSLKDFPDKTPIPLSRLVIKNHLLGKHEIGIYPLLDNNESYFIAADFDGQDWTGESCKLLNTCRDYGLPAYLERSRSGEGAHVWLFFGKPYSAVKSRQIIFALLRKVFQVSEFDKEISFDRVFPNQDYHSGKGFGNLIALPLNGVSVDQGNSVFLNPEDLTPFTNQWEYLAHMERISTDTLDRVLNQITGNNPVKKTTQGAAELRPSLQISIRNQIYLQKRDLNEQVISFLRDELNFINSEYIIKQRLGRSVYQTEKYFKLIQENENEIMIPRGFVSQLTTFCQEHEILYHLDDQRQLLPQISYQSNINLLDHQKTILDTVSDEDYGVIVAPAGSGKTIIGLELIAKKGQPALILVHRNQLLQQWLERIEAFLGIPRREIGQYSGTKKKMGKQITIASMQTLARMDSLDELRDQFGIIIVDECHHIPAKTFREAIVHFNPYYLYGLTATPKRKHNDEKLIFIYVGDIISEIEGQTQPQSKTQGLEVEIRETALTVPFDYRIDEFQTLSRILTYDTSRNNLIVEDVLLQIKNNKRVLILTERKEHVDVLELYLKGHCEVITMTGNDSVPQRKIKMEQVNLGHYQVLIATGQLFGEGLDVSNLDVLCLAYPFSFEGKLIQYIGRIQRSSGTKLVIDYRDKQIDYFEKMFKKRNKYYKKIASR